MAGRWKLRKVWPAMNRRERPGFMIGATTKFLWMKRVEPQPFTPEIVPARTQEERELAPARPVQRKAQASKVIRYQLNLTPKSKTMFEELMKHVQMFSSEGDTRTSEVFQGIIGILHSAMDELDLADLPRRGAWGSVTAKNFPNALGGAFEQAIVKAAKKRGVG